MTSLHTAPTIAFAAVVLLFSLIAGSRLGGDSTSLIDYFLMKKELRAGQLGAAFVAADMSVATVVLALGLVGYRYGFWAAVWITVCWLIGIFLFLRFIRTPWLLEQIKKGHTLHEVIGSYYDSREARSFVRATASFITVIVFILTVGLEFFAGFVVFTKLPGSPSPFVCSVAIAVAVIVYTVRGGFRGTTRINIIRLGLVISAFVVLAFLGFRFEAFSLPRYSHAILSTEGIDLGWLAAIVLTLVPAQIAAMDMWQRCSAANGHYPTIKRGLLRSLPLYLAWLAPPYVGALARAAQLHAGNPNYVVLDAIQQLQPTDPAWWSFLLQPLLYGGLVATIGCTTDTLLNATTFTFMLDIYPAMKNLDPANLERAQQRALVSRAKLCTALLGLSAFAVVLLGLFFATVYDLVAAIFSVQVLLFWPIMYIVLGQKRNLATKPKLAMFGLIAGMLSAFAVLAYALLTHKRDTMDAAPLAAMVITGFAFTWLYLAAPKREIHNKREGQHAG